MFGVNYIKNIIKAFMNEIMNTIGRVAEGKNFFGRIKEIQHAIELLEDGANLILAAPRRVGKTSFARKLKEEMENKGWKGVYIDLQLAPTEICFMEIILREIKGINIFDWLQNKTPEIKGINIKEFGIEFNKRKPIFYQEIEKILPHDKETLIILDEFVIFLNDVLRIKEDKENDFIGLTPFLNWLRALRQMPNSKIRWIICSSISVESYLHKINLTKTINDLTPFKLDELKGDEPKLLIQALADSKKVHFTDEHIKYILEKLRWKLPYFIQILFKEIIDLLRDGNEMSIETIDNAYVNLLEKDLQFNTWTERLSYYDSDKRFASLILQNLSKFPIGLKKNNIEDLLYSEINDQEKTEEVLERLLKGLENDGYIMYDKEKYTFRSPLLRDFWNNKFGR